MQLLVASAGGHLTELMRLRRQLDPADDVTWVTYDSPQARELWADHPVVLGHGPSTRSARATVANYRLARQLLARPDIERVVSTGAGIAVPFLAEAARRGLEAVYVESATRVQGPSLSGRMLERVANVACYSQWPWARDGWQQGPGVFDSFSSTISPAPASRSRQILVTLGTHPRYRFDRLVAQVGRVVGPTDRVIWQAGATPVPAHLGKATGPLSPAELDGVIEASDIVIGHAGVGTALKAMEHGRCPILVPRRRRHGEHVDDHQVAVARLLDQRGLVLSREAPELSRGDLRLAASRMCVDAAMSPR